MKLKIWKKLVSLILLLSFLILLPGSTIAAVTKNSWKETASGGTYIKEDYTAAKSQWLEIDGQWYHFDENGMMDTDWFQEGNTWYYLDISGFMRTGWVKLINSWYYLGADGAMRTGWIESNGNSYYLDSDGVLLQNTTTPDGQKVDSNGAKVAVVLLQPTSKTTSESETQPASQTTYTVYITPTGQKYHRSYCRTTTRSRLTALDENEAIRRGYGSCKVCKP